MGRIPQFLGQAAMAASIFAVSASLINAGGAKAVACNGSNGANFDYTLIGVPTQGGFPAPVGNCISPVAGNPLLVNVDHDYPDANQPFNTTGTLSYTLVSYQNPFLAANIDADIDGLGTYNFNYTKEVFDNQNFTGTPVTLTYTNINGTPNADGPKALTGFGSQIWVRDSWTITGDAEVDNITNTFQTPGPLPILGAGAAFGFSRKLRGRIKAARLG
jgi:hypothetical protein